MILRFIDDPENENHKPRGIFRCVIAPCDKEVIAKVNYHREGDNIRALQRTLFSEIMPKFYGTYRSYILMEDLASSFVTPCRLDFKMGTRTWDVNMSDKLRSRLMKRNDLSVSPIYGLRLVSTEIIHKGSVAESSQKSANLALTYNQIKEKIYKYVNYNLRNKIVDKLNYMIKIYKEMLREFPYFRIYSGSILICFDGADSKLEPKVAFIDFAHCHIDLSQTGVNADDHAYQDGVLIGMKHLKKIMETEH